jgi:hypothetical protein
VALADLSGKSADGARKALGDKLKEVFRDPADMLKRFEPRMAVVSLEAAKAPPVIGGRPRSRNGPKMVCFALASLTHTRTRRRTALAGRTARKWLLCARELRTPPLHTLQLRPRRAAETRALI